jgi:PIN domain nuclease of toxin-antitoxin system
MKCLLDTHTVIWLAENSPKLSQVAVRTILDPGNKIYVSIASAWEVAIKCSIGKLKLSGGVLEFFQMIDCNGITVTPISSQSLECLQELPLLHRDPFDRLLVATAITECMTIISADTNISLYGASVIW